MRPTKQGRLLRLPKRKEENRCTSGGKAPTLAETFLRVAQAANQAEHTEKQGGAASSGREHQNAHHFRDVVRGGREDRRLLSSWLHGTVS